MLTLMIFWLCQPIGIFDVLCLYNFAINGYLVKNSVWETEYKSANVGCIIQTSISLVVQKFEFIYLEL